jgi:tRNA(Ile)-lysidine synthase
LDERLTLSLLETAGREAKRRMALAAAAAARIRSGARLVAPGLVLVDPVLVHDGGEEAITALRVLLACGGGRTRLPGIRETRQWQERLRGGASALARTIAIPRRKGTYLGREMRNLPQRDRDGVFDGRYRIEAEALRAGWRLVRREARDARAAGRPEAMAMACEPRLWHSGVDGSAGGAPVPAIARHLAPFERFLPGFDLELASAAAALFGRKPFPGPPLAEDGCAVF